jgi:uncharacterized protein (TIGR00297 family)
MTGRFSEDWRQIVHIAVGALALLLRVLEWWQAAILAGLALAFNAFLLPRIGSRLYRRGAGAGHDHGIILYPAAVLVLVVVFFDRLDIAAAAWGILAAGDGAATLVGHRSRGPRLPWNREKSVAGTLAFAAAGGAAGSFLCWWCRPQVTPLPDPWFSLAAPVAAAAAAAAVETIPIRLNDNVTVPAAAAASLWWMSLVSAEHAATAFASARGVLPLALAVNISVAAAGYIARTVSPSGAVVGAAIGAVVQVATGWGGWLLLLATFGSAVVATRLGIQRKTLLGIAEARGGRRGAGNAIANTGVAAAAAGLSMLSGLHDAALVAFVAALAAAGSDTMASEIGKGWGRRTYLVPTFRQVAPGTSGAVSAEGTAAGAVGALALGSLGLAAGLIPSGALVPVLVGAAVGSLAESTMGATLEAPGFVNNDVLNFLNTGIAAAVAVLVARSS